MTCSFCGREEEHILVLQPSGCFNNELRICSECNQPNPDRLLKDRMGRELIFAKGMERSERAI